MNIVHVGSARGLVRQLGLSGGRGQRVGFGVAAGHEAAGGDRRGREASQLALLGVSAAVVVALLAAAPASATWVRMQADARAL